jgi:hypothetical protein
VPPQPREGPAHMAKPKKPPPEPNPLVLEAMRPGIDVALRFGPQVREHIVYRGSREWMMTAEDPREATRLERAEAERLALYVAQQSPDLGRAALALSAAARYLAGTACVLHKQSDSREPASAP